MTSVMVMVIGNRIIPDVNGSHKTKIRADVSLLESFYNISNKKNRHLRTGFNSVQFTLISRELPDYRQ